MEGTIGEIRMFGGNFAPLGWQFCNGTLYSIAVYTAAYSILGTIYGGDGNTTFAVPDLRSRAAVGTGQGPGLSNIALGQVGGAETATMLTTQMPQHNHIGDVSITIPSFAAGGSSGSPTDAILGGLDGAYSTEMSDSTLAAETFTSMLGVAGASLPFSILQPLLATNYIICLEGIYPSRPI